MTVDDDVAIKLKKQIRESGKSAKEVINNLLRLALLEKSRPSKTLKSIEFEPAIFKGKPGLMPGYSWELSAAQIMDQLDEADIVHP